MGIKFNKKEYHFLSKSKSRNEKVAYLTKLFSLKLYNLLCIKKEKKMFIPEMGILICLQRGKSWK